MHTAQHPAIRTWNFTRYISFVVSQPHVWSRRYWFGISRNVLDKRPWFLVYKTLNEKEIYFAFTKQEIAFVKKTPRWVEAVSVEGRAATGSVGPSPEDTWVNARTATLAGIRTITCHKTEAYVRQASKLTGKQAVWSDDNRCSRGVSWRSRYVRSKG
jgi:hypothetical protein